MNRITPLVLAVAMFMEMMDSTVIATSLPEIARDIGTEPIALKLAMTSYLVALAIFIPISGWMADRFGPRKVFRWAIFVFMLGSIACAVSGSLFEFVGARFFQGMGGSMMTPLARLVMVRSVPKNQLVAAMAWLTVPALIGPVVGPPLGGFLTTFFSWHWIFLINIPIGALGIILATIYLPKVERDAIRPMDWTGFLLIGITFSGTLFGLSVISLPALPPYVGISTIVAGVAAGFLYMRHLKTAKYPLLNPNLLRHPMFRTAIIGGSIFRIGVGASPFLIPLMLQLGFGLTAFETGSIMLFGAVGAICAKIFITRLYKAFGFKHVMIASVIIGAILLGANGLFTPTTFWGVISMTLFFTGLLRSTFFTGVNAMSFGDIDSSESGEATAIFAVTVQISFALGVAFAGAALEFLSFTQQAETSVADFQLVFFLMAGITAIAVFPFMKLNRNAGSFMSGHQQKHVE